MGVVEADAAVRFFDEASGEMQIMFEIPPFCDFFSSSVGLGDSCSFRGSEATSEKKKDVLTVGVRGV